MIRASKNSARKSSTDALINSIPASLDLLISPQPFDFLLPFACQWAEARQERILREGQALLQAPRRPN
jgi:hypothetical protein